MASVSEVDAHPTECPVCGQSEIHPHRIAGTIQGLPSDTQRFSCPNGHVFLGPDRAAIHRLHVIADLSDELHMPNTVLDQLERSRVLLFQSKRLLAGGRRLLYACRRKLAA